MLLDEIQSGLGRTGKLFAYQHSCGNCSCDVGCKPNQPPESKPDGVILGKALGGGFMPVSCFLSSKEVMQWMNPGSHGSTFGGNPLAAAIAKRSIELLDEDKLIENSKVMGEYFKKSLIDMNSKIIKEVRGKGLWLGVEIDPKYISGKDLSKLCLENGILCKETHETTISYAPPLTVSKKELDWAIKAAGLDLELVRDAAKGTDGNLPQNIALRHKQYGSEHEFQVASNTPGLLSAQADVPTLVKNGIDVEGEIAGEEATGRGQVLTGDPGAGVAEGIKVRYTSEAIPTGGGGPGGSFAGTVTFKQNSMNFHVGANPNQQVGMSFRSMKAATLGSGVLNESQFANLEEVSLLDSNKAQDAMRVIDRAIEEVAITRGEMGAFQKNTLESNLNWLRIAHENVQSSESVLRDADMAKEMAEFTRNQILMDASTSMLAHANQKPMSVLKLLG